MPSNSSVATEMYNTRRSAYLNSCSTAMELPPQSMHQNWQDTEYVNTTCSSEMDGSDVPMFNGDKDDQPYYEEENGNGGGGGSGGKKSNRKRANTTSSNGGNDKESKRTANKICRVCGDKAFSYNFNVITCESCKAFFRRNANKEKEIRCPFNEQCEINMVSRRFCQRCRLTKCFAVGMKKEWIMSEEARLEKKQRVEENRERRLQDALNRALEEANMEEESENSYDEAPIPPHQISVRQYLANDEGMNQQHQQPPMNNCEEMSPHMVQQQPYNMKDDKMMNYYQDGPSDQSYSNQDFDFSPQQPQTDQPLQNPIDVVNPGIATTDNVASSSNLVAPPPAVEIDPKVIPTSVFLSASMSAIQDVAGMCAPDVVDGNLINVAQAAAQAQAIVNQTQQLAAAVVAQQVVAQMAPNVLPAVSQLVDPLLTPSLIAAPTLPHPLAPTLTTPISTPLSAAMSAPMNAPLQQVIPASMSQPVVSNAQFPVIPKDLPVNVSLLNQLEQTHAEMVTVPKEMLMKLIQNTSRTTCTCSCVCGRYPPGSCIVDEVTKDLLNGGSSNSSNATDREDTKLETTEDMQFNGLLPESNSSIHWLSQQSSAQAVVDPISHSLSAEEAHTQRERRDSVFGAYSSAEQAMGSQPKSVQEETFWEHTVAENESRELSDEELEKMEELTEISNCWISMGLDSIPILELFTEKNIEIIVNGLKLLSSFRFLQKRDKRSVIKQGLFTYCVIRWLQHKESMSLEGLDEEVQRDFMELVDREEFNYRVQPGAFSTLAISLLFHNGFEDLISTEVYMEHLVFKKLLDKNLPIKVNSDIIFNNYSPYILKAANHLEQITGGLSDKIVHIAVA